MEETYFCFQFLRRDWLYRRDRLCWRLEVFRQFVVTSSCGLNTSLRCFANVSAFSLSPYAHLFCVEEFMHRGEFDNTGLRADLRGFHNELS